ncbi:MAG: MOSC domain-containing protein [Janthinobacterium lividum]
MSLQIGQPQKDLSLLNDGNEAEWVSSIWKMPTTERVHLRRTDLDGNTQADLKNHGGPDKAVCCYSAEHYSNWRALLGKSEEEFAHGAFGENFTLTDFTEDTVCIGDTYTVGTATVQVGQPRMPCWKVGRRWERPEMPLEIKESGQTGCYLRVVTEGEVGAGDTLALRERPQPKWTVSRINYALYVDKNNAEMDQQLSRLPYLAEAWRHQFRRRAGLLKYRADQKK